MPRPAWLVYLDACRMIDTTATCIRIGTPSSPIQPPLTTWIRDAKGLLATDPHLAPTMQGPLRLMLKVTLNNSDNGVTLVLEGRLCGACSAEAQRTWHSAHANSGEKQIFIDLTGVSYVDHDGEALLQDMLEQGVTVRVGGIWMDHLVADLRRRIVPGNSAVSRRTPRPRGSPGVS